MSSIAATTAWLVPPRERTPARTRLFCLPHAGAGASTYRLWPDGLLASAEVWRVQPPGRELRLRETPVTSMDAYLDELVPRLLPLLDRPWAIFGHSLGALCAFGLIERIRAHGASLPQRLFVSACRSPQTPHDSPIHELPRPEFLAELERRYGGLPAELTAHEELLELIVPILRADMAVYSSFRYRPTPPLDLPVTVFHGADDRWVRPEHLDGWERLTAAATQRAVIPGDHFYVQSSATRLIDEVRRRLSTAAETA